MVNCLQSSRTISITRRLEGWSFFPLVSHVEIFVSYKVFSIDALTLLSGWKKAGCVKARRFSDAWRTGTSTGTVLDVILSSPDDIMLLCNVFAETTTRESMWVFARQMSEKLETNSHRRRNTVGHFSERICILFQPRCWHHRNKTSINQSSLSPGAVHHASPGILPHGTGGKANERQLFIVLIAGCGYLGHLVFLFVSGWRHDQRVEI